MNAYAFVTEVLKTKMVDKKEGALDSLATLGVNLPSRARRNVRLRPLRNSLKSGALSDVPSLPECFAEVTRRASSKLAAHARERATLEAVASTLAAEARSATGSQAAGIYLASLVVALRQVVSAASPSGAALVPSTSSRNLKKKTSRKQMRLQKARDEQGVQDMSAMDVRAPQSADKEMRDSDATPGKNDSGNISEDAHFIASLVYLISLAALHANRALVNAKAADILGPINVALSLPSQSPLLARHAPVAISTVLSVLESSFWTKSPEAPTAFLNLLTIASSSAPKSRRRAREALVNVQKKVPLQAIRSGCATAAVAKFIRSADSLSRACAEASSIASKEQLGKIFAQLLHHINSVKYFGLILDDVGCAKVAKQLVILAQGTVREILPFAYDVLGYVVCIPKTPVDIAKLLKEDADMFSALSPTSFLLTKKSAEYQPRIPQKDAEKLLAAVIGLALPASSAHDTRIARAEVLVAMAVAVHSYYMRSPPPDTATVAVVKSIVDEIDPLSISMPEAKQFAALLSKFLKQQSVLDSPDVFNVLEKFSTIKFKRHWSTLLPVFKEFVSSGAVISLPRMQDVFSRFIERMVKIRGKSTEKTDVSLADALLASAVRGGGASFLLKFAPLQRHPKDLISNAWVLPILRYHVRNAPLSLWSSQLSKLQTELDTSAREFAKKDNQVVESANMKMYSHQLLSLLPGLCTSPTDLSHSQIMSVAFQAIHYCFNYDNNLVQNYGSSALRALSESVLAAATTDSSDSVPVFQASFNSRLKKLFESILQLAEKLTPERRGSLLEAVTVSCCATNDSALVTSLLRKSIRRFLEISAKSAPQGKESDAMEDTSVTRSAANRVKHSASDVAIAVVESGIVEKDAQEYSLLRRALTPFLQVRSDPTLQKKAYRSILTLISAGAFTGTSDGFKELVDELAKSATHVAAGAQSMRLATVEAFIEACHSSFENEEKVLLVQLCTSSFLPEAVISLRDTSEKTRQAGLSCIAAMTKAWDCSSEELGANKFFVTIAAGLGGRSTSMISGSLLAMGHFMRTLKDEIRSRESLKDIVSSMFGQGCTPNDSMMTDDNGKAKAELTHVRPGPVAILLRHESVEVQRAALNVLKIAVGVLASPISGLLEILPGFLPSLVATSAESKKKAIRLYVKVILERLLRKCGREVLESRFPEEHKRLLSSVRKAHEKEKSKRQERKALLAMKANGDVIPDTSNPISIGGTDTKNDELSDLDFDSDDSDGDLDVLDGNEMLLQNLRKKNNTLAQMEENPGDVIDLLASDSINISEAKKNMSETRTLTGSKTKRNKSADDDEPLVFMESGGESDAAENGSDSNEDDDNSNEKLAEERTAGRKRLRKGLDRNERGAKKAKGTFGDEYRSKRGAGDVKRAGRPDPFAYVPLGSSFGGSSSKGGKLPSSGTGKGGKAKRRSKSKTR